MAIGNKILFLAQLPPPFHGQSAVTAAVHAIFSNSPQNQVHHVWHGGAKGQTDVGKRSALKYVLFAYMILKLTLLLMTGKRYDAAYLGMAPWAHSATRDAILITFAKLLSKRVFVHVHGEGLDQFSAPKTLKQVFISKALSGSELIAITEETAQTGRDSGLFTKVFGIPNFAEDPGEPCKPHGGKLKLCTLGNLDSRKGVFEFVHTIGRLREMGIDVEGALIGGGSKDLSVETMRAHVEELELSDRINVTGRVEEGEKARILSEADIFLYPSRHDLAPLALIEAIANGCVPIVFSTGGIPGIVGPSLRENCVATPMDNAHFVDAAANIIAGYHNDRRLLEADAKSARNRFLEAYSAEKFERSVLGLLETNTSTPKRGNEELAAGGHVA